MKVTRERDPGQKRGQGYFISNGTPFFLASGGLESSYCSLLFWPYLIFQESRSVLSSVTAFISWQFCSSCSISLLIAFYSSFIDVITSYLSWAFKSVFLPTLRFLLGSANLTCVETNRKLRSSWAVYRVTQDPGCLTCAIRLLWESPKETPVHPPLRREWWTRERILLTQLGNSLPQQTGARVSENSEYTTRNSLRKSWVAALTPGCPRWVSHFLFI